MAKPSDEKLTAYLDGALDPAERAAIARWLEHDLSVRLRAAALGESAALLRAVYDEVLREPVPARLIAAARGGKIVDLTAERAARQPPVAARRPWAQWAVAASLFCLFLGAGLGWLAARDRGGGDVNLTSVSGLDKIAALYMTAATKDHAAGRNVPQDLHVPNLRPWGLDVDGVGTLDIAGGQAALLYYTTDNKALGPLAVIVGRTAMPDTPPTAAAPRDGVNLLYWAYHGHAYAIAGTTNPNYLWNIYSDIAYQFDGI
jgi:anti-sigma factor RsiW